MVGRTDGRTGEPGREAQEKMTIAVQIVIKPPRLATELVMSRIYSADVIEWRWGESHPAPESLQRWREW